MQFGLAQLRLSGQLRTNQRHDPSITVQAHCHRVSFDRAPFGNSQPDFDTRARLPDRRPR
ncbi:hypothetical protein KDW80_25805 [Burkholderia vietnamiensis]|nr:hypothetical protein [Burkholderia vietnamiensis]